MDIEKIIRENIAKTVHLSLATVKDDKPWVSEVHFAYDEDLNLYFRSLTSRRHSLEIAANPNVAGSIVKQHSLDEYPLGVYFEGLAELMTDGEARNKAAMCINKRLKAGDDILDQAKDPNGHQFYKITVDTFYVFGKFSDEGGKKYELKWNGSQ
jgi:uncharacterized protein YhbP (UPF0306 family)